jgi:hypothetical protein
MTPRLRPRRWRRCARADIESAEIYAMDGRSQDEGLDGDVLLSPTDQFLDIRADRDGPCRLAVEAIAGQHDLLVAKSMRLVDIEGNDNRRRPPSRRPSDGTSRRQ